jgi:dolichol kinase
MKDALEVAGKLGIGGGIGFLLGWLIVWWVEPTTRGGIALLIVLPVVFCATVAGIVSKFLGGRERKTREGQPMESRPVEEPRKENISAQQQC